MFSPKNSQRNRSPQYDFIQPAIRSEHPARSEHPPVIVRLPLHRFRIGPTTRAYDKAEAYGPHKANSTLSPTGGSAQPARRVIGSLLSRRHDRPAGRNRSQQLRQIDLAFRKENCPEALFSIGLSLRPYRKKSQSFLLAETHDPFLVENASRRVSENTPCPRKYQSDDTPHIVLQIRVKKVHRPPHPLRRETSRSIGRRARRTEKGSGGMRFAYHNFQFIVFCFK